MSSDWFLCGDPGQHGLVGRVDLLSVEPAGPARGTGRPRLRSLLGLLLFFGDHCDFGTAVHGAIPTFFWLALLMLTYPAALHGALVGALADAARGRRRSGYLHHLDRTAESCQGCGTPRLSAHQGQDLPSEDQMLTIGTR
jgi:hypothetical protein